MGVFLYNLLGHDTTSEPGIALRHLVHFQGVHNILDLLSWDQEELKTIPAQQEYSLDDHGQGLYLRTNQIKQIYGLITYMKHIFGSYNSGIAPQDDPFHPFTPDEWTQQTPTQMRTYLIQHLPDPHGPEPVPSGPISSAIELLVTDVGTNSQDANMTSPKEEQSVTTVDGIPQGPTNNLINPYDQKAQRSYADVVYNNRSTHSIELIN